MSIIPPESYMSGGDVTLVGVILGLIAIAILLYAWEFIMNNILNHEIFERNLFIRGGLFIAYVYVYFLLLINIGYFSWI